MWAYNWHSLVLLEFLYVFHVLFYYLNICYVASIKVEATLSSELVFPYQI